MPKQFDNELDVLQDKLIDMERLAEDMMDNALKGLLEWNIAPFEPNLAIEERINKAQTEIDEHTVHLITVYTPVAADLRRLLMITRINAELERVGDQLSNIGFYSKQMLREPAVKELVDLPKMIEITKEMFTDSMQAFKQESKEQALAVIRKDDTVDSLNDQIFRDLMDLVIQDPSVLKQSMELILTARAFERIADHSVNIAEDVIYMIKGHDVRHRRLTDVESELSEG